MDTATHALVGHSPVARLYHEITRGTRAECERMMERCTSPALRGTSGRTYRVLPVDALPPMGAHDHAARMRQLGR